MRHEIMTKRTREEINRLADDMTEQWFGSTYADLDKKDIRRRCMALIFACLDGARDDYKQKAEANG